MRSEHVDSYRVRYDNVSFNHLSAFRLLKLGKLSSFMLRLIMYHNRIGGRIFTIPFHQVHPYLPGSNGKP